jgi:hypothetical protein
MISINIDQSINIKGRDGWASNRRNLPALVWTGGPQLSRHVNAEAQTLLPRDCEKGPPLPMIALPTSKTQPKRQNQESFRNSLVFSINLFHIRLPTRTPPELFPLRDFPATRRPLYDFPAIWLLGQNVVETRGVISR